MQYLLSIHEDFSALAGLDQDQMGQLIQTHASLISDLQQSGEFVASAALHPPDQSATVRSDGDEIVAIDGPYAETKEQLGGIYIVNVEDRDRAVEIAGRIPCSGTGAVEVRQINEELARMMEAG